MCDTDGMKTNATAPSYQRHRYPAEVIAHTVWLYFRFSLSFRDVEELMAARGVVLSYETVRRWTLKFGQQYANELRRRRPQPGDTWHLDEVFLKINGKTSYLWRAVDQDGNVLDILVQSRRGYPVGAGCCQEVLPQTPQRLPVCSARAHHRQTCQLWCSETGDPAWRRAPAA